MKNNTEHYRSVLIDLGLDRDPFGGIRDFETYYASPALRQRIGLVRHLLEAGRQVILISGPPQSGKSSMLDMVLDQHPGSWLTLKLTAGPTLNTLSLLTHLANHIELRLTGIDDQDSIVAAIREKLTQIGHGAKVVVLGIDDAEGLPSDTRRVLVDLAHAEAPAAELKIVMAANTDNSSILQNLQRDAPDRTSVHVVELPHLNREQTRSLIEHRMRACGFDGELPFRDTTLDRIFAGSGGVPGKIITLARQDILMRSDHGGGRVILGSIPPRLIYAGVIAVLILVGVTMWETTSSPDPDTTNLIALDLPDPTSPPPMIEVTGAGDRSENPTAETAGKLSQADDQGQAARSASASAQPDDHIAGLPLALGPGSAIGSTGAPDMSASSESQRESADLSAGVEPAVPSSEPQPGPQAVLSEPEVKTKQREQPATSPPPPVTRPDKKPERALTTTQQAYTIEWLLSQARGGYVLQLFGVRDTATAKRFIEKHRLQHKTAIYASVFDGKPWYVVLFGHYPNRAAAVAAIAELPPELRSLKPWAKQLKSMDPGASTPR